jgi:hypothetical protein
MPCRLGRREFARSTFAISAKLRPFPSPLMGGVQPGLYFLAPDSLVWNGPAIASACFDAQPQSSWKCVGPEPQAEYFLPDEFRKLLDTC